MDACGPLWEYLGWNMFSVGRHQWHFLQHFQGNLVTISSDTIWDGSLRHLSGCAEYIWWTVDLFLIPDLYTHNTHTLQTFTQVSESLCNCTRSVNLVDVTTSCCDHRGWKQTRCCWIHGHCSSFLLYCTFIDNDDRNIFHRQQIRSLHVSASSAVTVGVMNTHSKHTVTVSVIDSLEMLQKQPKHMQTSTAAVGNYTKLFL